MKKGHRFWAVAFLLFQPDFEAWEKVRLFLAVRCRGNGYPSFPFPLLLHLKGDRDFGDNHISGQVFPVLTALSKKEMSPFFHLLYALFTCFLGPLSL
ncbi:MAG: hypothetical protein SOU94_01225 [Acidaminococcus sp.]|mgnify:CR=1 FL=1|uniref:Uncharacterized protein n=1 Tax=Acidaminococcus intestini TaxID=187327 RepID=A0A943EBL8_9FIRM|nr:hypothetical protein [Acidaminococcus sp.]MBS5519132.1 hypothetical protein [Acidaminococcus intestini]MDY2738439.1 hypothetical protein [Acidaminococcus sp.]